MKYTIYCYMIFSHGWGLESVCDRELGGRRDFYDWEGEGGSERRSDDVNNRSEEEQEG